MKTVELFAGIGGFRLAADRHGCRTIWANDTCPKACMVYRRRFGDDSIVEGDIHDSLDDIPRHDLLTAGFPCQPFSAAGRKQGIDDPRGTLFSVIVDVLKRYGPRYFVLENVKRLLHMEKGRHFATILASLAELNYIIEWRLLNAQHFGLPQNRQRVFIVGVRRDRKTTHGRGQQGTIPCSLADEADLASLAAADVEWLQSQEEWRAIRSHGVRFPNWGLASQGRFIGFNLDRFSAAGAPVLLRSVLQADVPAEFDFTESTLARLNANTVVDRFVDGVEIHSNQGGGARMGYTIFGVNGVAPTLTSTTSRHYERYRIGDRYRRLTNVEYARIQGFPDDHCDAVSVYDQYALFGNAVPPPMAAWVIGRLASKRVVSASRIPRLDAQRELFADAHQA